jgi:hypothetical protein
MGAVMTIRSFIQSSAFEPETISAMSGVLDAACEELHDTGEPDVVRERIATRIIAAVRLGERDPARLLIAARRGDKAPAKPNSIGSSTVRLDALGRLLYGEHWIMPMARDLQVCRDTMTNWASGKRELPPDHSVFAALVVLVHFHEKAVAKARRIMERNRI